jgi:hypothetical protein
MTIPAVQNYGLAGYNYGAYNYAGSYANAPQPQPQVPAQYSTSFEGEGEKKSNAGWWVAGIAAAAAITYALVRRGKGGSKAVEEAEKAAESVASKLGKSLESLPRKEVYSINGKEYVKNGKKLVNIKDEKDVIPLVGKHGSAEFVKVKDPKTGKEIKKLKLTSTTIDPATGKPTEYTIDFPQQAVVDKDNNVIAYVKKSHDKEVFLDPKTGKKITSEEADKIARRLAVGDKRFQQMNTKLEQLKNDLGEPAKKATTKKGGGTHPATPATGMYKDLEDAKTTRHTAKQLLHDAKIALEDERQMGIFADKTKLRQLIQDVKDAADEVKKAERNVADIERKITKQKNAIKKLEEGFDKAAERAAERAAD